MELGKIDKLQLLTRTCTKLKPSSQCKVGAPLVLVRATGDFRFTRLTTARIWGKPPPSPIQCTLHLPAGVASEWFFVSGLPVGSPEIAKVVTHATLQNHNFWCRPPIGMMFEPKLQPSSRTFQWCVACHLYARKSGRFPTFRGWESNYQFHFRPFFWP